MNNRSLILGFQLYANHPSNEKQGLSVDCGTDRFNLFLSSVCTDISTVKQATQRGLLLMRLCRNSVDRVDRVEYNLMPYEEINFYKSV